MHVCCCADPYCRVNGCRIANDLSKQVDKSQTVPFPDYPPYPKPQPAEPDTEPQTPAVPLVAPPIPKGCICPPTSEQTCQNPQCGRKPPLYITNGNTFSFVKPFSQTVLLNEQKTEKP